MVVVHQFRAIQCVKSQKNQSNLSNIKSDVIDLLTIFDLTSWIISSWFTFLKIIQCVTHHNFITVVFVAFTHFDEESTSDSSDRQKDIKTNFSRFHDPDFKCMYRSGTKLRRDLFRSIFELISLRKSQESCSGQRILLFSKTCTVDFDL